MPTKLLVVMVALACAVACGEERDGLDAKGEARSTATVDYRSPLPPMVPYSRHVGAYYDSSHSTFFTLTFVSPEDKTHFRAFGVDLNAQAVVFHIDCNGIAELNAFQSDINAEISRYGAIVDNPAGSVSYGSLGETVIGLPPPPRGGPPVGDQLAGAMIRAANIAARNQRALFSGAYYATPQ